jgi:hypothetical protein
MLPDTARDISLTQDAGRNDENLRCPLKGVAQTLGIVVIAPTDTNAAFLKLLRLIRVADADTDLLDRHPLKQLLNHSSTQFSIGSGDDYHNNNILSFCK